MRLISFALTTDQVRARTKTITRRLGWKRLQVGTLLQPVVKAQGIKKGEHVELVGRPIRVVAVTLEPLRRMLDDPAYGAREVVLEGFPDWTPVQFVAHFCKAMHCEPDVEVTRIEFEYTEDNHGAGG